MKTRPREDYYLCCCEWCDSENRLLRTTEQNGATCGACHRPLQISHNNRAAIKRVGKGELC